ncbi:shikimate kinase [Pelotomaculum propionicicum]|uniref:shikimate kinase n=1 Tax=Pelotomaculum propionicicum TaxID=258475 RepID=UPI003B77C716
MKNIVIIGFMATGKSTVGRRLAQRLGRVFIDTDKEIEAVTGKTVAQIFARDGAVRFRSEEALLVKKLSLREDLVIATGGGIVLDPENVRLLKKSGILVALSASPDVIYQRTRGKKNRPLLSRGDLREKIDALLKERENIYSVADLTVNTGVCTIEESVQQILAFLSERELIR